jgi:hypothetical protein
MTQSSNNHSPSLDAQELIARLRAGSGKSGASVGAGIGATSRLTRAQILQQAASAMLTQANGQANAVLALLR